MFVPTYETEFHCKQIRHTVKCNRFKQGYSNLLHAAVVMLSTYMRNSFAIHKASHIKVQKMFLDTSLSSHWLCFYAKKIIYRVLDSHCINQTDTIYQLLRQSQGTASVSDTYERGTVLL